MTDAAGDGMRSVIMALACMVALSTPAYAHCDALDGPVVLAAREALRTGDFALIIVWVKRPQEHALRSAFRQTLTVRALGPDARELADTYFFETAVRLHRESEGEPYTGLKRARIDYGPVLPAAEQALAVGGSDALVEMIVAKVRIGLRERFREAIARRVYRRGDIEGGRAAVASYVEFIHYAMNVYAAAAPEPARHEEPIRHEH